MTDLLLVNGTIVTFGPKRDLVEDGAVAIAGDRIVEVGRTADRVTRHGRAQRIDCRGRAAPRAGS